MMEQVKVRHELCIPIQDLVVLFNLTTVVDDRSIREQIAINRTARLLDEALPWMSEWTEVRERQSPEGVVTVTVEGVEVTYRVCKGCGLPITQIEWDETEAHDVWDGDVLPEEMGPYHAVCCPDAACQSPNDLRHVDEIRRDARRYGHA